MRPNLQANIELNAILEPAKSIFNVKLWLILIIEFKHSKTIIENAHYCSDKHDPCNNYKTEHNHPIKIIGLVYLVIYRKTIKKNRKLDY